jgi:hypothetical protein
VLISSEAVGSNQEMTLSKGGQQQRIATRVAKFMTTEYKNAELKHNMTPAAPPG